MSRIVAQFDPSAGSGSFQAGAVNRCASLWVMNESANFLQFDFAAADTPKIIQPWSNRLLKLVNPVQTVTWAVVATLQAAGAPASVVFVEGYEPSEDTSSLISGPLSRQTNVGNTVSTTTIGVLQNDGAAAGTTIIESTEAGGAQSNVLVENDGTLTLYGLTKRGSPPNTPATLFQIVPATTSLDAHVDVHVLLSVFASMGCTGNFSSDNGAIASDGAGDLTVKTLIAQAPVTLATGSQETGTAILGGTEAAGNFRAAGVNFKTNMTRTPTSITLTPVSQANISSISAPNIFTYGFELQYQATAAAFTLYNGKYTTVGNCLLAVDAEAQTFAHHCDTCGRVAHDVALSALHLMQAPRLALSYTCADCGAQECFDTHLTAADESDPTPQGSGDYATTRGAQAALIRALMTALGLEIAG